MTRHIVALLALAHVASAQEPAPAPAQPPAAPLTPPVLTKFVPAVYPPEAEKAGLQADVILLIDVDEKGQVTRVEVTATAGHGFDEAATAAAQQFEFSPGRAGDEPVPVRITYKYRFLLKKEEKPAQITLRGVVKERGTRSLLAGIPVLHVQTGATTESDAQGGFALSLPPGEATLRVDVPEYVLFETREKIEEGKRTEVTYYLERKNYDPYETIVRGRRPRKEVTQQTLEIQEVSRIPGTQGDTLKVVQNLPGVARPAFAGGEIIVWGSNPQDTGVYMDGVRIPRLYHFGGLRSVVNGSIVSDVNFVPGAYGARYGRGMGGIVEVGLRPPKDDRIHGEAAVDILDTSLLIEGPITSRTSFLAGARRSYVDAILEAATPEDVQFRTAPRYYDYQAMVRHASSGSGTFTTMVLGSDDKLEFLADDPDPNARVQLAGHDLFHRAILYWKKGLGKEQQVTGSASAGYSQTTFSGTFARNAVVEFDIRNFDYTARIEYERPLVRRLALVAGIDLEGRHGKATALSSGRGPREDEVDPQGLGAPLSEEATFDALAVGPYVEAPITLLDERLRIVPGLRLDVYFASAYLGTPDEIQRTDVLVEPRGLVRYQFTPRWAAKVAAGRYNQPPQIEQGEFSRTYGNPKVLIQYDTQYAAGVEYQPRPKLHIETVGFYKDFRRLVVASNEPDEPPLENEGIGHAYGGELLVRHDPTGRFFGWLAYTLMRSERRDHRGEEYRLFDFDQTHILTLVGSYRFGRNWEAGLRFRLTSGTPYNEVVGSYFNSETGQYEPIYSDQENDARLPAFHSLDLRIEKTWVFKSWLLSGYLELLNAYNRDNPEAIVYNYDFTERDYVSGLPILPVFGLKGQF